SPSRRASELLLNRRTPLSLFFPYTTLFRSTEHIAEQIALVQELEAKGLTYTISDGVYFDTSKLADYGKLARLDFAGLQEGARVEDRKSTRLNSSHVKISYAVFCLKKKKMIQ